MDEKTRTIHMMITKLPPERAAVAIAELIAGLKEHWLGVGIEVGALMTKNPEFTADEFKKVMTK